MIDSFSFINQICISQPVSTVFVYCENAPVAKHLFLMFKSATQGSSYIEDYAEKRVLYKNGAALLFISPQTEEDCRGRLCNYLYTVTDPPPRIAAILEERTLNLVIKNKMQ